MSHIALYRKKRPKNFGEMVGQPHIVRALLNQLSARQVSHAYLCVGTRGTGKTSAAKIFARAVNCLSPVDGEPCNACEICVDALKDRCPDIIEIDAASNNGVDNIRELREEVKFMPNQGAYKVYIIDEVHMLSGSAFNALLKTLEEPPAHVIFILATTDPQKVPATILSRCQRYDFRRIPSKVLTQAMRGYLAEEGVAFEDEALDYIAYHSDGAMRDALSILDQCISMGNAALSLEHVCDILGAVDKARLFEFADALAVSDNAKVMSIISEAMDNGRDAAQFAADLVRHFRDVLVCGFGADIDGEFSGEMAEKLKEQAGRIPADVLTRYIYAFSEVMREMRFAPHMRTAFEVCALKLCMPVVAAPTPAAPAVNVAPSPAQTPVPAPAPPAPAPAGKPEPTQSIAHDWQKFCGTLESPTRSILNGTTAIEQNGMVKIFCANDFTKTRISGKLADIGQAIAAYFKLPTAPNVLVETQGMSAAPPPEPSQPAPPPTPPTLEEWSSLGQVVNNDTPFS